MNRSNRGVFLSTSVAASVMLASWANAGVNLDTQFDFTASFNWDSFFYRDWTNSNNNQFGLLSSPVSGSMWGRFQGTSAPTFYSGPGIEGVYISTGRTPLAGISNAPAPIGDFTTGVMNNLITEVWTEQASELRVLRLRFEYSGWINEPVTSAVIQCSLQSRGVDQATYDRFFGYIDSGRSDLFVNDFAAVGFNSVSLITAHDTYLPGPVPGFSWNFYGSVTGLSAVQVPGPAAAVLLALAPLAATRRRRAV